MMQLMAASCATPQKYMLLDDRNVISTDATLVFGSVTKHPAGAMIKEERDYEMRIDNGQPNVWYDPKLKKWRAWYSAFTSCSEPKASVPYCNNAPQQCGTLPGPGAGKAKRGTGLLYAESDDGVTWYKPSLGLVEWKGSRDNNLVMTDGMTTGIFLDEAADAAARYKVVTGSNGKGRLAVSADGLRWNATKDLEQETHGRWDTPKNVVWDAVRSQWILYDRSAPTVDEAVGGSLRVQSFTHSLTADYMGAWAPTQPTGLNSSADYQPDGLVVWPYEGIYIGIGNVFNPTSTAGRVPIGQVNAVLGWSADGRRWKWLKPNDSFLPLGGAGAFDACGIFGAKQDPLRMAAANDTLRIYYVGCNGPFFGSRGCGLGMASMQRDGFAGYRGGRLVTVPVRVTGRTLKVSVDGGAGDGVRVGIADDRERSVQACAPLRGRQTDATVTWNGTSDLSKYINGAVTLVFEIPDDAVAFAFSV